MSVYIVGYIVMIFITFLIASKITKDFKDSLIFGTIWPVTIILVLLVLLAIFILNPFVWIFKKVTGEES